LTEDIYAFVFRQQEPMAGAGLQGNKITKTTKYALRRPAAGAGPRRSPGKPRPFA
jgi:hypothetical protein